MNDKQLRATTPSPLPPEPRQVSFAQAEDRLRFFARLDQFNRAISGTSVTARKQVEELRHKQEREFHALSIHWWKIRLGKCFFQGQAFTRQRSHKSKSAMK